MFTTRKGLLLIIFFFLLTGGFASLEGVFSVNNGDVQVSDKARVHILQGDKRGGGHKFGLGKACKSEFPKSWTDDEVIDTIQIIAANDNLKWRKQANGYYMAEDTIDSVRVRVVLDRKRDDVVTAYPINTKRNACPPRKPANDNYND